MTADDDFTRTSFDVVVVGGGLIGCAVAWRVAGAGLSVALVERSTPGREASWAAAGMLAPGAEAGEPGPFTDLARESLARYPAFVTELEDAAGMTVGFEETGSLLTAFGEDEAGSLRETGDRLRGAGIDARWLGRAALRTAEPDLVEGVRGGLHLPEDRQVENRRLARAAWLAAARAGVEVRTGIAVEGVEIGGGAVRGVRLRDGSVLGGDRVAVAAGAWSGRIGGLPRELPVVPVRGEMAAVEVAGGGPRHMLHLPGCYLVPRPDGRVLVGATEDRAGFRAVPTAAGIAGLLDAATEGLPALAAAPVAELWAGLRPGTPDDLPILGPDPDVRGLIYATGHFRNGILLAPVTADAVAAVVSDGEPDIDLAPYRPDRFTGEGGARVRGGRASPG